MIKNNQIHFATWATIIGVVVGTVTFYEDLHEQFALYGEVEALQVKVDKCVTIENLQIILLKRDKIALMDGAR
jgi:hypothetical protein